MLIFSCKAITNGKTTGQRRNKLCALNKRKEKYFKEYKTKELWLKISNKRVF